MKDYFTVLLSTTAVRSISAVKMHLSEQIVRLVVIVSLTTRPSVSSDTTKPPGLKVRFSQAALDHVADVAVDKSIDELLKKKLPEFKGVFAGSLEYGMEDAKVINCNRPISKVVVDVGEGVTWSITGVGCSVIARWYIRSRTVNYTSTGRLNGNIADVNFTISVTLAKDTYGRPNISVIGCDSKVGSLQIHLSGDLGIIYTFFLKGWVEGFVKRNSLQYLCGYGTKLINTEGRAKIQEITRPIPIGKDMLLDYSLIESPIYGDRCVESEHKGEVSWRNDPGRPPFAPSILPQLTMFDTRMVYVYVSDYLVNSLLYAAYYHGMLDQEIPTLNVPGIARGFLRKTCPGGDICLGTLIPDLGTKYANGAVSVYLKANQIPKVKIVKDGISFDINGDVSLFVRNPGQEPVRLITLNMTASSAVSAKLEGNTIRANITHFTVKITGVYLTTGNITSPDQLRGINVLVNAFIEPELRKVAEQGIGLPKVKGVKYSNTVIRLESGFVLLGADVEITQWT